MSKLTIRIIETTEPFTTKSIEVEYNSARLTRGVRKQIEELLDPSKFMTFDPKKLKTNKEEAIETMDLAKMQKAETDAMDLQVAAFFGLGEIKVDSIVDEDFEKMVAIVKEQNYFEKKS